MNYFLHNFNFRLRSHFESNPREMALLRHDKALHTVRHQSHLRSVPDYIIPQTLKKLTGKGGAGKSKKQSGRKTTQAKRKYEKRKNDPLRNLIK